MINSRKGGGGVRGVKRETGNTYYKYIIDWEILFKKIYIYIDYK